MRSFFFLAVASLFLAGDNFVSAAFEESVSIEAPQVENESVVSPELNNVDRDIQSRRKDWDIFSTLLMMLDPGACLENNINGPIDCHEYKQCMNNHYKDCQKLCEKSSKPNKSHYSEFCSISAENFSASTTAAASTSAESNSGNQTPGGFMGDGNLSMGVQFWMVAAAMSVGMALVAIHMGQRREAIVRDERSLMGAEVRGSVGRRVGVVSGLMDGVLTRGQPKQVEMLEIERADTYESAMV